MSVLGFEPKIYKLKVYCFYQLSYTLIIPPTEFYNLSSILIDL